MFFFLFSGSLQLSNYLVSNQYIPERIRNKFNEKSSFMVENGLQQFFESFGGFLENLRDNALTHEEDDDDSDGQQALTVDNFQGPITLVLCLLSVSCLIFLIEIIVFKLKERRILRDFVYHP